ncbi:MAG: DNA-3-methyladenine glycosylase [Fibrobacteres bacterium]|jgi:DNA-3-methyladenine glycosylase|nr:DNA-3-methyladenine glycosylase [Fibrobacterota bacterium]
MAPRKSSYRPVPAGFFSAGTVAVARALLGKILVSQSPEGRTAGRIVETEAYLCDDAACHASRGETKRNRAMFGPAGRSYTYLIYGMYRCFNVVTGPKGVGEAVLIRALEPIEGFDLMAMRRGVAEPKALCSGPGKLVIALGIADLPDGSDLRKVPLMVAEERAEAVGPGAKVRGGAGTAAAAGIKVTTRIGISKDAHLPLRFYLEGSPWISRK